MTTTTFPADYPFQMLDDRQRRVVENPRAASARRMREVAVHLESMADAADNSWFELSETNRASMRELASKIEKSTQIKGFGPLRFLKSLPGAFAWIKHADDVMTFASALQRFQRSVMRRINEEREGSASGWLSIADNTFMAALKRGDAEFASGNVVRVDRSELDRRTS
jgi:hypothetical protein